MRRITQYRWCVPIVLVTATLGAFGLRLWMSRGATVPTIVADEIGYLANARVFGGGKPTWLSDCAAYWGGYPLLISPAFWFSSDPVTIYRSALVLTALWSSLYVPATYWLLRMIRVGPFVAIAAAVTVAVSIDATFWSTLTMSESVMGLAFIVWLAAIGWMAGAGQRKPPTWLGATVAGIAAGYLGMIHFRAIVIAIAGTVVVIACYRLIGPRLALAYGLAATLAIGAGYAVNLWLLSLNWPDGQASPADTSDPTLLGFIRMGFGLSWYLVIATAGLSVLGIAWLCRRVPRAPVAERIVMLVLGVGVVVTVGVVAYAFAHIASAANPTRIIYGRYEAIVTPALIACGVAWFGERAASLRSRLVDAAIALAVIVTSSALTVAILVPKTFDATGSIFMAPAITAINLLRQAPGSNDDLYRPYFAMAVVLSVLAIAFLLAIDRRRFASIAVMLVFSLILTLTVVPIVHRQYRAFGPGGATAAELPEITTAHTIVWDTSIPGVRGVQLRLRYATYAPRATLERVDLGHQRDPGPADIVVASLDWKPTEDYRKLAGCPEHPELCTIYVPTS